MTEMTRGHEPTSPADTNVPVIVFGRDSQGKAHASRFDAAEALLAERAAGIMRMRALRLTSSEEVALGEALPKGRIFPESGRGFVPFVAAQKFAQLEAAPNAFAPERPADAPDHAPRPKIRPGKQIALAAPPTQPETSSDVSNEAAAPADDPALIKVGSLVLASEEGEPGTWYLAEIVGERDANMLEVRWGGEWKDEPVFIRRRDHLALFPHALTSNLRQNKS